MVEPSAASHAAAASDDHARDPEVGPAIDPAFDDAELAVRFRAGDPAALRFLFDRYAPAVARLARASLRDPADIDDVVQATFVSAWKGRGTYRDDRSGLLTWLLSITRRRIVDVMRSRGRIDRDAGAAARSVPGHTVVAGEDPDRVVDRLLIADELSRLSDQQQRVLTMSFYGGLTHVEIAEKTGMALGTVKSHLKRGLHRLRTSLDQSRADPSYTLDEGVE